MALGANPRALDSYDKKSALHYAAATGATDVLAFLIDRGVEDTSVESAVCKVYGSEMCWRVVNEALQMVRPMARMKDLRLEQAAGEPPRVDADPFAIRQLLLNLLLNALDFARGRISISTARTDEGRAEVVRRRVHGRI